MIFAHRSSKASAHRGPFDVEGEAQAQDKKTGKSRLAPGLIAISFAVAVSFLPLRPTMAQSPSSQPAPPPLMQLPDSIVVNSTGAATYSIPIAVPPGTGGLQPKISLDYSSQSPNGIAGVGWTIGGLLTVDRCAQTVAQDGANHQLDVFLWTTDRFCVDGQRLDLLTGTYGSTGAEYRTERESFTRFISNGTTGYGPASFTAATKDGQFMEFGNTADSSIDTERTTTPRTWAVNKVRDTAGNYMTITYAKDKPNSDFWPTRIDYTGNAGTGLVPYASVRFVYDARTDTPRQYAAGNTIRTTKRLNKIQTYLGENLISEYRLAYDTSPASGRARLTSITMCAADSSCLPATAFTYGDGGYGSGGGLTLTKTTNSLATINFHNYTATYFGDWNGDGITDAMTWDIGSGNNRWFVSKLTTNGTVSFNKTIYPITPGDINSGTLLFGDWNGDGATDMLWWDGSNGNNRFFISNRSSAAGGLSFTKYEGKIPLSELKRSGNFAAGTLIAGDWNGDGITDLVFYDPSSGSGHNTWYINQGITPTSQVFTKIVDPIVRTQLNQGGALYFGDWNGDGITDFVCVGNGNGFNRWYMNSGAGSLTSLSFTFIADNIIPTQEINDGSLYVVDWNNDGVSDLVFWNISNGTNRWYANKGKFSQGSAATLSFVKYESPIEIGAINGGTGIFFGDWNGDGIPDVMWWRKSDGRNRWYLSNGGAGGGLTFTFYENPISTVDATGATMAGGTGSQFVDWNGDGIPDVMWWNSADGSNRWFLNNATKPDYLTHITAGLGIGTTITYDRLTKGSPFYTRDTNATRPTVDFSGATYVVQRIDRDDGIGGTRSLTYRYAGAKIDALGRGSLGFRTVTMRDEQTTIEETTTYRQDWPFTGLVSSVVRTLNSVELSHVDNTLAADALTGIRKFVKLTQSLTQGHDIDGTALPTVTKTFQYDAYGNVTQSTSSASDGYSMSTVNTYLNDTTNWLLGRLTRSEVTSTTP